MSKATLNEWLEAALQATEEVANTSFGWESSQIEENVSLISVDFSGSYIAMIGEQSILQVGLTTSHENCYSLAQGMLGIDDSDQALTDSDVADAMGELVNILAGGIKARMSHSEPLLKLGLPMVVHGRVELPDRMETTVAKLQFGPVQIFLLILRG